MTRLALLLVALALSACGLRADAEQARVCRLALPALNEGGARITVLRALPGPGAGDGRPGAGDGRPNAGDVRLDYAAEGSGGGGRGRWGRCRLPAPRRGPPPT